MSKRRFTDSNPEANRKRISGLQHREKNDPNRLEKRKWMRSKRRFKRAEEIDLFVGIIRAHMRFRYSKGLSESELANAERSLGLVAPNYGEPLGSVDGRIMRVIARLISYRAIPKGRWPHAAMVAFEKRMAKIAPCLTPPVRLGRMRVRLTDEALGRLGRLPGQKIMLDDDGKWPR